MQFAISLRDYFFSLGDLFGKADEMQLEKINELDDAALTTSPDDKIINHTALELMMKPA